MEAKVRNGKAVKYQTNWRLTNISKVMQVHEIKADQAVSLAK